MTATSDTRALAETYRLAPIWHQAVSDAQALVVANMRTAVDVAAIAAELELSDKRIYQLLDEAKNVRADLQRMRRAGAVAGLIEKEDRTAAHQNGDPR